MNTYTCGCRHTFTDEPDDEGLVDCPECGIWFKAAQGTPTVDVTVTNHGTIFTFALHTEAAREWWTEHVEDGMEFAGNKVVEHRFAQDIAEGMQEGGLVVE
jgi:hypothetical protein